MNNGDTPVPRHEAPERSRLVGRGARLVSGRNKLVVFLWLILALTMPARAQDIPLSTRFCILPVANGTATEADVRQAWRMVSNEFDIPGLPGPVFTPTNRKGAWTIIDRTYQPYDGPFPRTYLDADRWVVEPWSGLVVASRSFSQESGLWIIRPGSGEFTPVNLPAGLTAKGISAPYLLLRQKQTIVTVEGLPFIVQSDGLTPWMTPQQMAEVGIKNFKSLYYSDEIAGIVAEDGEGWIHVLPDGGTWHRLNLATDPKSYILGLINLEGSNAVLLNGSSFVDIIRRTSSNDVFEMERIETKWGNLSELQRSTELKQVLRYMGGGLFDSELRWFKRSAFGYQEVPGGRIAIDERYKYYAVQDLTGVGALLVHSPEGPHLYDGDMIRPIVDENGDQLHGKYTVRSLPILQRALLLMWDAETFYELSADAVARPFVGVPGIADWFMATEWDESGVAVVPGDHEIFIVEPDLATQRIEHGETAIRSAPGGGQLNGSGELLLVSRDRLMVLVDKKRDPKACLEKDDEPRHPL